LSCAEIYLLPASLILAGASFRLLKVDNLFIPGMRKYGIGRDVSAGELAEDEVTVSFTL